MKQLNYRFIIGLGLTIIVLTYSCKKDYLEKQPLGSLSETTVANKAGVEGLHTVALGEVALVGEHAVVGQIDLAVQVLDRSLLDEDARDEIVEPGRFLDETNNHRHLSGCLSEFAELIGIHPQTGVVGQLLQEVAGERQLGEHQEVDLVSLGLLNQL